MEVRQLTHTLRLPPAQSELYDGPHSEWLRDILEQLPNLQSLVVSQLPFFDHSALLALRQASTTHSSASDDDYPIFPMRLLIATRCANTTSAGLAEALLHWPRLVFLDLSETLAARDHGMLSSLRYMEGLQVLKLRQVGLRDDDVEVLADAIGIRVRSLDLRNNRISDTSVRKLLNNCFNSSPNVHPSERTVPVGPLNAADEDWPSFFPRPNSLLLDIFRGDDLDKRFVGWLTKGVVSRLPNEDLPRSGLTHLYIANNFITVEGVASLLMSQDLNFLDAGTVDTAKALWRPGIQSSNSRHLQQSLALPGAEKLIPVLEKYARKNLTCLRIHHRIVSERAPGKGYDTLAIELSAENTIPTTEVSAHETGLYELSAYEAPVYQLDASAPVYELAENSMTPRYELPGDPTHFLVSPPINQKPSMTSEERDSIKMNRGSIFAPEPICVTNGHEDNDVRLPAVLTESGLQSPAQDFKSTPFRSSNEIDAAPSRASVMDTPNKDTGEDVASVVQRRDKLRTRMEDQSRGLLPGALPALRSLILTDVPCRDSGGHVVEYLKKFISDCAEEANLANLQATLEHNSFYVYGKPRSAHHQYRALGLFSLEHIILEMAPARGSIPCAPESSPTRGSVSDDSLFNRSKSSTEDADTEAFWNAQANDFSFFGDEECGLPAAEPGLHFPLSALSEKMVLPAGGSRQERLPTLQRPVQPEIGVDVVQELAKFRKERKAAHECAVAMGEKHVEGYWPGEVKVIRHQVNKAYRSKNIDWYGNYFEKGIYR